MSKTSRTSKTSKMLYRRRVSIKWLERFGIKRGDTAIIAFDGDVKMGELGYFEIEHFSHGNYNQFAFTCEPDSSCYQLLGESQVYGICLREKEVCRGNHKGTPYGRVVRIERNGEEVTVGLKLRPFDERKPRPFTLTGEFNNAHRFHGDNPVQLKGGDTVLVNVGASYKHGDIVLINCSCCQSAEPHYHAKFFYQCHGKKYAFRLADHDETATGTRHLSGEEKMIVGPIIQGERFMHKKEKPEVKGAEESSPKQALVFKTTLEYLSLLDPKFSIHNGRLRVGR